MCSSNDVVEVLFEISIVDPLFFVVFCSFVASIYLNKCTVNNSIKKQN